MDKVELGSAVMSALENLKVKEKIQIKTSKRLCCHCFEINCEDQVEIPIEIPYCKKCCMPITIRDDL